MNYWLMTYETPFTVLLTVIGFLLVVFAQIKINTTYSKYRKEKLPPKREKKIESFLFGCLP